MAESSQPDDALASPEVEILPLLLAVAGGLVFLALTMVALAFVYAYYGPRRPVAPPQALPVPQLLPDDSATELDQLIAAQHKRLENYRWANSAHTLVTVPIERAMGIVAGRGAGAYGPVIAARPAPSPSSPEHKP